MAKQYDVTLVGGEKHRITTVHSDLMWTERTLASRGLDATGKTTPVHYVTALIWSALRRLGITSTTFDEFADLLEDFDAVKDDQGDDESTVGPDPTQPAAVTGSPFS